jgi:hypothetical protein
MPSEEIVDQGPLLTEAQMIKKDLKRQKQRANKKKKKLAANFDYARFKTALMVMARGSLIPSAVLTQLAKNLKPKKSL